LLARYKKRVVFVVVVVVVVTITSLAVTHHVIRQGDDFH